MKHNMTMRQEFRYGMRHAEFRVVCDCGYVDKARTEQDAKSLMTRHNNLPHRR